MENICYTSKISRYFLYFNIFENIMIFRTLTWLEPFRVESPPSRLPDAGRIHPLTVQEGPAAGRLYSQTVTSTRSD